MLFNRRVGPAVARGASVSTLAAANFPKDVCCADLFSRTTMTKWSGIHTVAALALSAARSSTRRSTAALALRAPETPNRQAAGHAVLDLDTRRRRRLPKL